MFRFFLSDKAAQKAFKSVPDLELITRYKKRSDKRIISELFNRYIHLVYAVCMKYFQDDATARDFAMVVFEELGEKINRFEVKHFKSWLLTITRNTCLMELRKKKHEYQLEPSEFLKLKFVENEPEVHPKEATNIEQLVVNSLHNLKDGQRICLELMYFKDKSYKQIAQITGYSLKEVKSYIQNGKRKLKGILGSEYEKEG